MSDQNPKGLESLRNEDCDPPLVMFTSVAGFLLIEQLLTLLVYQHSDWLERLSFPSGEDQKTFKDLKVIATEARGKIFPANFNSVESQDIADDTEMLENVIEAINSKCKEVFQKEKGTEAKHSVDKTDEMFYQKLYCLLNCAATDYSRNKEPQHAGCKNVTTSGSNSFAQSTCSLEQRVSELEAMLEEKEASHKEAVSKYENESAEFRARIASLEEHLTRTEEALNEIATEYYDLMADIDKKRKDALFRELMQLNRGNTSTTQIPQPLPSSEETGNDTFLDSVYRMSEEESSSTAEQSLVSKPTSAIELELYNNYKLLLLQISEMLLHNDKEELQKWVASTYSVETSGNVYLTLVELDKRGIISSSNLSVLIDFFEHIVRIDLIYIIDSFLVGNYTYLRSLISGTKENKSTRANMAPSVNRQRRINPTVHHQGRSTIESSIPRFSVGAEAVVVRRPFKHSVANEQSLQVTTGAGAGQAVPDGARRVTDTGSNGSKLSKPQSEQQPQQNRNNRQNYANTANNTTTGPWLCDHYKRRCLVKFECCERYWPCHRCHNSKSNCGQKKLKSRDIKMIKCVPCQREQPFNETSQFCCSCGIKFADYFCARCKHLTGTDDNPYHCEKCGICRIHGDRSFHCDICGVCLDVQLKDNHKCREGSAHDECCICLEDAFTGCQILPCSHKVHKECATQMIRSGITRCPICRESFAHKLERRPLTRRKK